MVTVEGESSPPRPPSSAVSGRILETQFPFMSVGMTRLPCRVWTTVKAECVWKREERDPGHSRSISHLYFRARQVEQEGAPPCGFKWRSLGRGGSCCSEQGLCLMGGQ
jgi:hypothetical protein